MHAVIHCISSGYFRMGASSLKVFVSAVDKFRQKQADKSIGLIIFGI